MNTLGKFAWQLGAHARITLAHSLVWHRAYVKATPETQAAWRADFIANFLMGNLEVTEAQAKAIIGKTRTKRSAAQENAYRSAEMKFKYHISRKTSKNTEPAKPTRTTAAEKAAFARFLAAFDGDVARLKAVVKALA
jgi:hypothetical protein